MSLWVLVGVLMWGLASCSITCPDGNVCPDLQTCCKSNHGYSCCPYPNAVCCSDMAHCCPSGFSCNLAAKMCEQVYQPWLNVPMVEKEAAEDPSTPSLLQSPVGEPQNKQVPDQLKSSVVYCDSYTVCPDRTTCCRHPAGPWFCCPYPNGWCCLDGFHCCQYGYHCDLTYTHCIRRGLPYPFSPRQAPSSVPASFIPIPEDKGSLQETPMTALTEASGGNQAAGVIRCDSRFYCAKGTTCCKGSTGQWGCCPYPLGECCADGKHCCQYGYTCDPDSSKCRRGYSQIPSGTQEHAKTD